MIMVKQFIEEKSIMVLAGRAEDIAITISINEGEWLYE